MDYMILLNYSMSNDRSHGGNPRFGNNCDNNNNIIIMDIKKIVGTVTVVFCMG